MIELQLSVPFPAIVGRPVGISAARTNGAVGSVDAHDGVLLVESHGITFLVLAAEQPPGRIVGKR